MASADIRPASPAMMPNPNGVPTRAAAIVVPAQAAYVPTAAPTSRGLRTRVARPKATRPRGIPMASGSTTPRLVSGFSSSQWTRSDAGEEAEGPGEDRDPAHRPAPEPVRQRRACSGR